MAKIRLISLKNQKAFECKSKSAVKYSCRFFTILVSSCSREEKALSAKSFSLADQPIFYGFKISKKFGKSVARNKIRRWLKNIYRQYFQQSYATLSVIFIPKIPAKELDYHELDTNIKVAIGWCFRKIT